MDARLVGQLLGTLEENGLLDNTAIVYVSDHGEMAGEHGLWWKMSFYEGSVGVPMIVSLPGTIREGVRETTPVSLIDLPPTLAEIGGAPELPGICGRSLLAYLTGGRSDPDRRVFSELFIDRQAWREQGPSGGAGRMLRKGGWKCVYHHGEGSELYDLRRDPQEMDDRSGDPACQSLLESMLAEILADWEPQKFQAAADRASEQRAFVRAAGGEVPAHLESEYWRGPAGYGWVDPV